MENIEKIIELYNRLGSVWKVGNELGLTGQKIHSILKKNGVNTSKNPEFTNEQLLEIKEIYSDLLFGDGKLDLFCKKYNKNKSNVCRKAKKLGFTNEKREYCNEAKIKISLISINRIKNNGHPKGMLNKNHSKETKLKMGVAAKEMWKNPNSKVNTEEHRQNLSDRFSLLQSKGITKGGYSRGKQGWYDINGRTIYFRSLWEANYALYLDFLIHQKEIEKWEFEVDTFWFEKIKRGVRSYKPDFKVFDLKGEIVYHEVKGWMDDKSKTKLKRMKLYHPTVFIKLIEKKQYDEIKKQLIGIINFF